MPACQNYIEYLKYLCIWSLNSNHYIGVMILSPEIWRERKMAEMSTTIVCPVLFKQIACAESERHRLMEAKRDKKRESALWMKGYASSRVFVLSITGEGCQESEEIKVNNSGKCARVCTLLLIVEQSQSLCLTPHNSTNSGAIAAE